MTARRQTSATVTHSDRPADLAAELRDLVSLLRRRMNTQLPPNSPSLPELNVLSYLQQSGPLSQVQLANLQHIRPQSMGATVAALEAAGLVERHADPDDRRRLLVSLTSTGRAEIVRSRRSRENWLSSTLRERLDPDERRTLADAVVLLRRVVDSD